MAMTQRDKRALVLGGVGVGVIALYLLAIEPGIRRYEAMIKRHDTLAVQAARFAWEAERNHYMDGRIAECEAKAGKLTKPGSYSEQITTVSNEIVTASQSSGAQVHNSIWSAPTAWPEDPSLAVARVQIDAEADWESVFKFIAALYRVSGVLSVEEMELTSDQKKGGKVSMRLSISVLVEAQQGSGIWAS
jgi:hypothetical protein